MAVLLCVSESALPGGVQGEQRALFDRIVESAGGDPREIVHLGVTATTKIGEARGEYPAMAAALVRIRPTKIIALGGTAATVVKHAKAKVAITKTHGMAEWLEYGDLTPRARALLVCTLSPGLVMRRAGNSEGLNASGAREWFRDLYHDVVKWVRADAPFPTPTVRFLSVADTRSLLGGDQDHA